MGNLDLKFYLGGLPAAAAVLPGDRRLPDRDRHRPSPRSCRRSTSSPRRILVEPPADPGRARAVDGADQPVRADPDHRAAADDPRQPPDARRALRPLRRPARASRPTTIIGDMRDAHRVHRLRARRRPARRHPGRHHHRRLLLRADAAARRQGRQRARHPDPAGERQRSAPAGPSDTLDFFQGEVDRLVGRARPAVAEDHRLQDRERRRRCPTASTAAATSRRASRSGCSQLEREETGAAGTSAPPWSGCSSAPAASLERGRSAPRRSELEALQSQLVAARRRSTPRPARSIRLLETRIAALERLVAEQQAARAVPGADGSRRSRLRARPRAGADRRAARSSSPRSKARDRDRRSPTSTPRSRRRRPTSWCSASSSASSPNLQSQYNAAVASARPGPGRRAASRCCRRASASR